MVYFIIGLVVLLIVAPIIAVLPSKRQKEQMALRREAMAQGINVEITTIDDPISDQEKYRSSTGKKLEPRLTVSAYRVARPQPREWRREPALIWRLERRATAGADNDLPGTWCWAAGALAEISREMQAFVVAGVALLPDDVVCIEENNRIVSLYWHERSGQSGLHAVRDFLNGCIAVKPVAPADDLGDASDHS
jgi:hypothetical protein